MILAAAQPYFAPFAGFFYKAARVDLLVILDDVQFPRGTTWITRNRFKNAAGSFWMTIPVWKKGLGLQKIRDVRICHEGRWAKKHLTTLITAYSGSPFIKDHLPFLENLFSPSYTTIIDLNLYLIRYVMEQLRIETDIRLQSEFPLAQKGNTLLVELCRRFGASHFLAQSPAKKYLNSRLFSESGITLSFFRPPIPVYPQLWGHFIPNLSTLDLLLNCGPKAHDILLGLERPRGGS
jgi:hypothetical protein